MPSVAQPGCLLSRSAQASLQTLTSPSASGCRGRRYAPSRHRHRTLVCQYDWPAGRSWLILFDVESLSWSPSSDMVSLPRAWAV